MKDDPYLKKYRAREDKERRVKEREYNRQYQRRPEYRVKLKGWQQSISGKYSVYKLSAKVRKIQFALTLEQFKQFWQQPCSYCGSDLTTIGLDRVDNSIGYTLTNVVPCCITCNRMKMTLPVEQFVTHIRKLFNHLS